MPKSKRDKKVSLTKTDKKGLVLKQKIVEDVRNSIDKYNSIYVFTYENLTTKKMQDLRQEWKPSRIFMGKNRIIALGLGRTPEEEVQDDLHKLAKGLKGHCGVLFTDKPKDEVIEWFNNFSFVHYARSGFKATSSVKLEEGPLTQFAHSLEPYLRKLGMPTKLDKGVVTLIKKFKVCKKGGVLTPEQAKILELLEVKMATFHFILKACWVKGEGFEKLDKEEKDVADVEMDDVDDE